MTPFPPYVHIIFVIAVWRAKEAESAVGMKYWEIIADNLSAPGWNWAVHLTLI